MNTDEEPRLGCGFCELPWELTSTCDRDKCPHRKMWDEWRSKAEELNTGKWPDEAAEPPPAWTLWLIVAASAVLMLLAWTSLG